MSVNIQFRGLSNRKIDIKKSKGHIIKLDLKLINIIRLYHAGLLSLFTFLIKLSILIFFIFLALPLTSIYALFCLNLRYRIAHIFTV